MPPIKNIFEREFDRLSESLEHADGVRAKLIEAVLELSEVKRLHNNKQVLAAQKETELGKLLETNQQLKMSLMGLLIEKEELALKKSGLTADLDLVGEQLEELDEETLKLLRDERVENAAERFEATNELSLMNKIMDAKSKLYEYGYTNPDILE